jgi:hypothetical protein
MWSSSLLHPQSRDPGAISAGTRIALPFKIRPTANPRIACVGLTDQRAPEGTDSDDREVALLPASHPLGLVLALTD